MLPISKRIDHIIQQALAVPLKAAGFKKQARTFRRHETDGNIAVINIQSGKYNTGSTGEFAANLGFYLPALAEMLGEEILNQPHDHHAHFHIRLGWLMPEHNEDYWFQLTPGRVDETVAAELQTAVLTHGLAWFAALAPATFKNAGADWSQVPGGCPVSSALCRIGFFPDVDPDQIPHHAMPEGKDGSNWHEWLPANAILVIDEAQRYWRPRANGSTVPEAVKAMETHRHKGVDIFLLTQHPRLLDINVKSFVENHKHISKSHMGGRRIWEWQRAGNPDNKGDVRDALVKPYKLDKASFGLYKSAEVHTKIKTSKSIWFYLFPLIAVAALALSVYAYMTLKNTLDPTAPKEAATAAEAPAAAEGEAYAAPTADAGRYPQQPPPAEQIKTLKPEDYTPTMEGKPWTAPAYAPHNAQLATMPFPVACVKSGSKCTCYTDQATPIRDMDKGLCIDFAENGIYNPYKAATGSAAPQAVGQTEGG